jgi:uncharacterized membrane protein (DUF4010 family)
VEVLDAAGLGLLPVFGTSLAIGLLIGLERERKPGVKAGLRTIALVALTGTLCAMIGEISSSAWVPAAGLLVVGLMMIAAYHGGPEDEGDPGTTTVVAVLVAYALGALTYFGYGNLAVVIALTITALLYFKPELRGILQRFQRRDLLSLLQFGALTFVVLPILPDQGYGPYEALNPHRIWLMVVLISGLSLIGYVALHVIDQRRSAVVLGVFGGLVSTTAATLLFSRHGRSEELAPLAAKVILIANLTLLVRLTVLAGIVAHDVLPALLPVMGSALGAGVIATLAAGRHALPRDLPPPEMKNPTELRTALGFGVAFGFILFLAAWLTDLAGTKGLYVLALAAGIPDLDAITLSTLQLFALGNITPRAAVTAIVLAMLANQVTKLVLVFSVGGAKLLRRCVLPMVTTGAVAALATLVAPL